MAVPELRKLLRDSNLEVRQAAAQAVFAMGTRDARVEAAEILGQYHSQAGCSLRVLEGGLKDENPAVRAAANRRNRGNSARMQMIRNLR